MAAEETAYGDKLKTALRGGGEKQQESQIDDQ
jgi:hypothetical protein